MNTNTVWQTKSRILAKGSKVEMLRSLCLALNPSREPSAREFK